MSIVKKVVKEHLGNLPGFRVLIDTEDYLIVKVGRKSLGIDVDGGTFNLTKISVELIDKFDNIDSMMLNLLSEI